MAGCGARAAGGNTGDRVHEWQVGTCWFRCCSRIPARADEAGFVADRNVTIEYRWAADQLDRLPAIAAELVSRPVSVIAVFGTVPAAGLTGPVGPKGPQGEIGPAGRGGLTMSE